MEIHQVKILLQNGDKKTLVDHSSDVNILAENGDLINSIFKPSKNGYIGYGGFAFTFKGVHTFNSDKNSKLTFRPYSVAGILLPIDKEIVMKFTKLENKELAEAEYEMYTYLDAIDKPEVELYGIPAVYYYGQWQGQDLIMMGLTLLDKKVKTKQLLENDVNILIVLRDFVRFNHC